MNFTSDTSAGLKLTWQQQQPQQQHALSQQLACAKSYITERAHDMHGAR
jgi:hypothetical protein